MFGLCGLGFRVAGPQDTFGTSSIPVTVCPCPQSVQGAMLRTDIPSLWRSHQASPNRSLQDAGNERSRGSKSLRHGPNFKPRAGEKTLRGLAEEAAVESLAGQNSTE